MCIYNAAHKVLALWISAGLDDCMYVLLLKWEDMFTIHRKQSRSYLSQIKLKEMAYIIMKEILLFKHQTSFVTLFLMTDMNSKIDLYQAQVLWVLWRNTNEDYWDKLIKEMAKNVINIL